MSQSSTRLVALRIFLIAVIIQGLALACDKSPTGPEKDSRLALPNSPMYGLIPGGFTANAIAWNQISLSWSPVPSATGYQLFRSTTGVTGTYTPLTGTIGGTSYVDAGLTGATEYCYEIRSVKNAGKNVNYSALSSPACATTQPPPPPPVAAPSQTDAAPQGYYVVVKWQDNSNNETGFHVETALLGSANWSNPVDAPANATSATVYVPAEQQTCFRVIAFNTLGPSNPSTPDCTTVPAGPSNLSATIAGQTITLAWSDNSAFEDGYKVSRSANGGAWTDIATVPASTLTYPNNTLTYQDASVATNVTYRYVVVASKDGGVSNVSNQVTVLIATTAPTTPGPAGAAWYPDTEGYGYGYLYVWWSDDPNNNEAGYRVEYSADGKTGWTPFYTAEADANYIYLQYDAYYPPPGGCYRVIAFNNVGDSGASDIACVEPEVFVWDLSATAIDQQEIDLTWSDASSLETSYIILRSTDLYGYFDVVGGTDANVTSYQDKGLVSGQEYWYLVVPVYPGGGWGNYSNYASATTTTGGAANRIAGTVLRAPTSITAVRVRGVRPPARPHHVPMKAPGRKK